jgi:hypothetical protein
LVGTTAVSGRSAASRISNIKSLRSRDVRKIADGAVEPAKFG